MAKKLKLTDIQRYLERTFRKFSNYTKHQKTFVLFLFVLAAVLILLPIAKITPITQWQPSYSIWLLGKTYFKSAIVIVLSLGFLFGWNMHTNFKRFIIKYLGFRETEPVLNFMFLWIIVAAYMGILDTLGLVSQNTGTIGIAWGLSVQLIVLVVGLIMSVIEVWKSANQNSQKTKILNIVDDDAPKRTENKRVLQHLFEDEEL